MQQREEEREPPHLEPSTAFWMSSYQNYKDLHTRVGSIEIGINIRRRNQDELVRVMTYGSWISLNHYEFVVAYFPTRDLPSTKDQREWEEEDGWDTKNIYDGQMIYRILKQLKHII